MNNKLIKFFTFLSIFGSIAVFAENERLTLFLKGGSLKMDYTETGSSGSKLDTESSKLGGKISGFEVGGRAKLFSGVMGGDKTELEALYSKYTGKSEYVGSLIGSGGGYGSFRANTQNNIREYELNIIETRYLNYGEAFFKFGYGDRLWRRELSPSQTEDYKWRYAHVGFGFDFKTIFGGRFGLNGRYQYGFSPTMESFGLPISATFKLKGVDGYRFEAPVTIPITKHISLIGSYKYDYWKIKASSEVGGYYEPDSKTKNHIGTVGILAKW